MTDQPPTNPGSDSNIERTLTDALRTQPLSEPRLGRLRAAVAREWLAAMGAGEPAIPMRTRWLVLAAAAVIAAVTTALWVARPTIPAASIGSMTRVEEGGLAVRSGLLQQRRLKSGDLLRVGDRLTARGPVLVTLTRGGTLRIAAGSSLSATGPAELSLERGLIYLDIPPGSNTESPFRVATKVGAVEHVGTEFEVKSDDKTVRVRVREGRIRFLGTADTIVADAGTELLVTPGKTILQRSIHTYGGEWLWTAALAPNYEIEGRPLIGFLTWVSRELGRPLDFADANARQIADRTILHGSIRDQSPFEAMSNVLATTSLTYEIRGDTIWVRSGP
ncbi:MAG TPA: FecR domain-containing protein [Steroidobacteraceae bacterium]|nr:FecR domain-containing protein [Steroidobacteraceae bacterium]